MNYAIISPDSKILTAVGDENHVYFYEVIRDRVAEWKAMLLCCRELQTRTDYDDGSCFTVAFSPSSHLCAVGSQSGIITIFDVSMIRESKDDGLDRDPALCLFLSSRTCPEGGAVRCMSFSPDPWDLLVWIEDTGRVGIADIRQAFCRRQILTLDLNESCLQRVTIEDMSPQAGLVEPGSDVEGYSLLDPSRPVRLTDDNDPNQHAVPGLLDGPPLSSSNLARADSPLREHLSQHSPEGDQIIEFLRARFTQRLEEGRDEGVSRWTFHVQSGSNLRAPSSVDGPNRSLSPFRSEHDVIQDILRENYLSRTDRQSNPRRQSSVVLSQVLPGSNNQTSELGNSTAELQPIITLRLATSPSSSPSRAANDGASSNNAEQMNVDTRSRGTLSRSSALLDTSSPSIDVAVSRTRQRSQRSSSIPRRPDRPVSVVEGRHEVQRAANSELRSNVAADQRHRRHRLMANEVNSDPNHWERLNRQHLITFDQTRSSRRIRNNVNGLPDRDQGQPLQTQDPGGTAGVGWGANGRTL